MALALAASCPLPAAAVGDARAADMARAARRRRWPPGESMLLLSRKLPASDEQCGWLVLSRCHTFRPSAALGHVAEEQRASARAQPAWPGPGRPDDLSRKPSQSPEPEHVAMRMEEATANHGPEPRVAVIAFADGKQNQSNTAGQARQSAAASASLAHRTRGSATWKLEPPTLAGTTQPRESEERKGGMQAAELLTGSSVNDKTTNIHGDNAGSGADAGGASISPRRIQPMLVRAGLHQHKPENLLEEAESEKKCRTVTVEEAAAMEAPTKSPRRRTREVLSAHLRALLDAIYDLPLDASLGQCLDGWPRTLSKEEAAVLLGHLPVNSCYHLSLLGL